MCGDYMKTSKFFANTMILTISNILTGTIGFIFSIILSREIGAKGVGLYQLVMPLYLLFLSVTGGGITVTISKVAAEKKALGRYSEIYKTIGALAKFQLVWSSIITTLIVLSSKYISVNILSDSRTLLGILAFCPAIIIVSLSSVYKGAFYGLQKVTIPAFIDIFEKIARIVIIVVLIMAAGNSGVEVKAAAAIVSLSFGELVSFILFYICYKNYVRKNPAHDKCDNGPQLIINVLKLSIPLAVNGILSTIFGTITTVLIPKRLQAAGIPYETALSLLGKLQGMALTIATYPAIVIGALNVILIPTISEAIAFKKDYIVNHRMTVAITFASVAAFSSSAIMLSIPERLGLVFYGDPMVGEILKILVPGIPILYLEMITFSILNGLGKQTRLLINSIILSISELILIYAFLGIPSLGIKGFGISFVLSGLLGLFLSVIVIRKTITFRINIKTSLIIPFLCSILLYIVTESILIKLSSTPFIVLLGYLLYLALFLPIYKYSRNVE